MPIIIDGLYAQHLELIIEAHHRVCLQKGQNQPQHAEQDN